MTLNGHCLQLLQGSLLGDGCLVKTISGAQLKLRHGEKQRAYLQYKVDRLSCLSNSGVKGVVWKKGEARYPGCYCEFHSSTELLDLYHSFYSGEAKSNGQRWKLIRSSHVSCLDDLGLSIWYGDDGSPGAGRERSCRAHLDLSVKYCVEGEATKISSLLDTRFMGVKLKLYGDMWRLIFDVEATQRLGLVVNPLMQEVLPEKSIEYSSSLVRPRLDTSGIYRRPSGNFEVSVKVDGKQRNFGSYPTFELAKGARDLVWGCRWQELSDYRASLK